MIACPSCGSPNLAKHGGALGTPLSPITCAACGAEFHPRYFWLTIPLMAILSWGTFLLTLLGLAVLWRGVSAAAIVIAGLAGGCSLGLVYWYTRRDQPKRTTKRDKLVAWVLIAAIAGFMIWTYL